MQLWLITQLNYPALDGIALTKLDVLDTFKEIKICIGYKKWKNY